MKSRPILFSTPMVQALLAGRKTQTRRIVKLTDFGPSDTNGYDWHYRDMRALWNDISNAKLLAKCPYGVVGERLWVRETWSDDCDKHWILYKADMQALRISCGEVFDACSVDNLNKTPKWKSSMFMPRHASRLELEITGIRVEQLRGITRGDAMAEGCPFQNMQTNDPIGWYADLWESINGEKYPWPDNPWVWVIEFKVVKS